MIEEARNLLVKNKWQECFNFLIEFFKDDEAIKKEITHLNSRYNSIKLDFSKGIVEYERKDLILNQIRNSLLELISNQELTITIPSVKPKIELNDISENRELVNLKFVHFHSGTIYNVSFPINSYGRLLQEKLKEVLKEKQKMIFEMEDGRPVTFGLFYEREGSVRKKVELNKTLNDQGLKNGDVVILKIYPSA